ncbi:MAG: antitoxin [Deltaproteobacteria bacterium]|nr:MAG: antitoxin [Deltaproteobacteria bacterium]
MKAITIRGIDPELDKKLKLISSNQGKSINRLILEMIRKSLGLEKTKKYTKEYDDLDDLFGSWTDGEFDIISSKINQERQIDPELWE